MRRLVTITDRLGRDHDPVVVLQAVHHGRTNTAAGGQSRDDQGIDALAAQVFIEPGPEKSGRPALFKDRFVRRRREP